MKADANTPYAVCDSGDHSGPYKTSAPTDKWYSQKRLGGLSRFALAITVLTIVGHAFLGFEHAWIAPFVALLTTYSTDLIGESLVARKQNRRPCFSESRFAFVKFLLPAHISGLAIAMLLYAPGNPFVISFAAAVAMASKYLFRTIVGRRPNGDAITRHFLNPSNFGISIALLVFPAYVGLAPPYQFSESTSGVADWLIPAFIICLGSYLNIKATGKIPLILAWLIAFIAQALLRSMYNGTPLLSGLIPATGFAFILYTFYMITDPATTPMKARDQVLFGVSVAALYATFMQLNIVFGLFYALTIVTALRGIFLYAKNAATFARLQQAAPVTQWGRV